MTKQQMSYFGSPLAKSSSRLKKSPGREKGLVGLDDSCHCSYSHVFRKHSRCHFPGTEPCCVQGANWTLLFFIFTAKSLLISTKGLFSTYTLLLYHTLPGARVTRMTAIKCVISRVISILNASCCFSVYLFCPELNLAGSTYQNVT